MAKSKDADQFGLLILGGFLFLAYWVIKLLEENPWIFWVLGIFGAAFLVFKLVQASNAPQKPAKLTRDDRVGRADAVTPPASAGNDFIVPFQLNVPEFTPRQPAIRKVASQSEATVFYQVNLANLTCSCPDWTKSRSQFRGRDARRLCKHLLATITGDGISESWDGLLRGILLETYPRQHLFCGPRGARSPVVFAWDSGRGWVDVYVREKLGEEKFGEFSGEWACYGYNVSDRRWSYNNVPPGAREIARLTLPLTQVMKEVA